MVDVFDERLYSIGTIGLDFTGRNLRCERTLLGGRLGRPTLQRGVSLQHDTHHLIGNLVLGRFIPVTSECFLLDERLEVARAKARAVLHEDRAAPNS